MKKGKTIKTYTEQDMLNHKLSDCQRFDDFQGQIVAYTNLWRWKDGSIRSQPDPSWTDWTE